MDLEYRGNWTEVGQVNETKKDVLDLKENNKYKFRVRAGNKVGLSQPVELSEPVTAKDPWSKY